MMSENTPKNIIEETISVTSLKRIATPKEIANVALFLSLTIKSYNWSDHTSGWRHVMYSEKKNINEKLRIFSQNIRKKFSKWPTMLVPQCSL